MSRYMENIRQHYAKSGWPHVRKVRKVREGMEMSGKKYVPHMHTNVIRIRVRRKNIHATYMPHAYHAFRNT